MTILDGKPVLEHSADLRNVDNIAAAIAVVPPDRPARVSTLESAGWSVITYTDPDRGLSSSIATGVCAVRENKAIDQVIILLADMPRIPGSHISNLLLRAVDPDTRAIMTEAEGVLSPPALFKREQFDRLTALTDDSGAKDLFKTLSGTKTVSLPVASAIDIDRVTDLVRAQETEHA